MLKISYCQRVHYHFFNVNKPNFLTPSFYFIGSSLSCDLLSHPYSSNLCSSTKILVIEVPMTSSISKNYSQLDPSSTQSTQPVSNSKAIPHYNPHLYSQVHFDTVSQAYFDSLLFGKMSVGMTNFLETGLG